MLAVRNGQAAPMDITAATAALAQKRAALESQLATLTAAPPDLGGISFGKRVGEGTSIAVERLSQIAAHDRLRHTLADVDRAQHKLEEGTYGTCDSCGGEITSDRLDAMPWATQCITCAAAAAH
jgi:DnaK suppressor protein